MTTDQREEARDKALDRVIEEIRNEPIEPAAIEGAADRVWARVSAAEGELAQAPDAGRSIRGCGAFQALIPAALDGQLSDARALLLEDHVRECAACRKALLAARTGRLETAPAEVPMVARPSRRFPRRWALAAAVALAIGLAALGGGLGLLPGDVVLAEVEDVDGALYQVAEETNHPLGAGGDVRSGRDIRTARGSGAVMRLEDGSRVELADRSQVSLSRRGGDTTIHLHRGRILVEAADGEAGSLRVDTGECMVSVSGAVFTVNHGTRGSRVSVLQGEARVAQSSGESILVAGDQLVTGASLGVPVEDEIAWSRDLERHLTLLAELRAVDEVLTDRGVWPDLRYDTGLLDLVPAETAVFVTFPNASATMAEAHRLLRERIDENDVLRAWWAEEVAGAETEMELDALLERVAAFGDHLGDEIVLAFPLDEAGDVGLPIALAGLARPDAFPAYLAEELAALEEDGAEGAIRVVEDPLAVVAETGEEELLLWIGGDMLVATPDAGQLRDVAAGVLSGAPSGFAGTPFHGRLAEAYRDGVGWLVAVDAGRVVARAAETEGEDGALARQMGLLDVAYFVAEQREIDGQVQNRAVATFDGPRRGIVSWLAAPAPIGALDFVSPDASLAAGFVVKEPALLVDELLGFIEAAEPELGRRLAEFEAAEGVDVRADIAAPLGGEMALALDGAVLPEPAWKLVLEVYDPERLQQTIEWAVERLSRAAAEEGLGGFTLEAAEGDRTVYTLRSPDVPAALHYSFVEGYMIVSSDPVLIERAAEYRALGYTLTGARAFRALLPSDGDVNVSAVLYQNLGQVLGALSERAAGLPTGLGPEQRAAVEALGEMVRPMLVYANAGEDRIEIVSRHDGGPIGAGLGLLFGVGGVMGLGEALDGMALPEPPGLPPSTSLEHAVPPAGAGSTAP